jgi:hypothetical protein
MRPLTTKYEGECRKCGTTIPAGAQAVYEKRVGIFCPGCAPTETEKIRAVRQEAADRKADRLDGWAEKRRAKAGATLDHNRKHYLSDLAFVTQPGRFPLRDRVIRQNDAAMESLQKAESMAARAKSLRHVQVAGDAEERRERKRAMVRIWIEKGMRVEGAFYGVGTVTRINKKTATIEGCGVSGTLKTTVELSWVMPLPEDRERVIAKLQKIDAERTAKREKDAKAEIDFETKEA